MISKTGLAWVVSFGVLLLLGVVHPIYPFLAYLLDYFQHPPLRWWGRDLPDLRWSLTPAIVWLVSCVLHGHNPLGAHTFRHPQSKLLAAYVLLAFVLTPFAVVPERSLEYADALARLFLLYLLIVATVRTRRHFRWVVLALMIGGFTWGWDAWRDPKRQAGRLQNIGGPDSRNDNSAAATLLPVLAFAVIYLMTGDRKERLVGLASAPFVANTIILCNSRGASVAMMAAGVTAIVITKGQLRRRVVGLVAVGGVAFLALADPQFIERQLTIFSSERDGSAQGRLVAWQGALRVIQAYPFGAGGGGFDFLSPRYVPELTDRFDGAERGVHNTYINIATDYGVVGLLLFLSSLLMAFLQAQRVRASAGDRQLELDALGLQIGLVAFGVAAFFINRVYAEVFFWLPGLSAALTGIQEGETAADSSQEPPEALTGAEAFDQGVDLQLAGEEEPQPAAASEAGR